MELCQWWSWRLRFGAGPENVSQTFNITPVSGYYIASVTADGNPVTLTPYTTSTYQETFSSVTADHTLAATFAPIPPPAVSISPASQTAANGATFNVNLAINTFVTPVRGWGANINFDASKLTCNGVTDGTFLSSWASANGDGTTLGGSATIDNTAGTVTIPGDAITGTANLSGPTAVVRFVLFPSVPRQMLITGPVLSQLRQ